MENIFVEAGKQRTGTFKRKGKELFTITIEAKQDVTVSDLLSLIETILDPESVGISND